jgi:putative glutamine amidotransferase
VIKLRPFICLSTYFVSNDEINNRVRIRGVNGQDMLMSTMDNLQAIKVAGGIPIIITPFHDNEYVNDVLKKCEAIILTGGSDINPLLYGEIPGSFCERIVPERDEFELMLLDEAIKIDMPVLGICRGMQLINIYFGGSLYQDLREANDKYNHFVNNIPRWHYIHDVQLKENSELYKAFGEKIIKTNSIHHQLIRLLGKDLEATALAFDSTIEGIESINNYFVLGVQWHPEMMFQKDRKQLKLFKYFIEKVNLRDR